MRRTGSKRCLVSVITAFATVSIGGTGLLRIATNGGVEDDPVSEQHASGVPTEPGGFSGQSILLVDFIPGRGR